MSLFTKRKLYIYKNKADGYTYISIKQKLIQRVHNDNSYVLDTVCDDKVYTFKLSRRRIMANSFNWIFIGKLEETEDKIIIEGTFGFEYWVRIFSGIILIPFIALFLTSLFQRGKVDIVVNNAGEHHVEYISWWVMSIIYAIMTLAVGLFPILGKILQRKRQEDILKLIKDL